MDARRRVLMESVAGLSALALASGASAAANCGALCGHGGSAGSVTVEQVLRRADGSVAPATETAAPIDRQRPARVETAVFGLG